MCTCAPCAAAAGRYDASQCDARKTEGTCKEGKGCEWREKECSKVMDSPGGSIGSGTDSSTSCSDITEKAFCANTNSSETDGDKKCMWATEPEGGEAGGNAAECFGFEDKTKCRLSCYPIANGMPLCWDYGI